MDVRKRIVSYLMALLEPELEPLRKKVAELQKENRILRGEKLHLINRLRKGKPLPKRFRNTDGLDR